MQLPSLDHQAIGARIAEARARAGLTQAELAKAIGIDRSALAKIENGTRRVSGLEISDIAIQVDERIEALILPGPAAIVAYRNTREPGEPSPLIERAVERIVRNVELAATHDDQFRLSSPPVMDKPNSAGEAELRAAEARVLLGLDDKQPACELATLVWKAGLCAFSLDLGLDTADAASVALDRGGVALVNGHLRVGRRRLALAHELGHHLFADKYVVDWRVDYDDDSSWESRLDRFARALLLPAEGVRTDWASDYVSEDDGLRTAAVRVASRYRVDMSTLARRLHELGMVSRSESREIMRFRTTKADIIDFNLVVSDELSPPFLPREYAASVLRLYREETVSPARAVDLLLDTWSESDLPPLPMLPIEAIWQFV